jgi:hypothetical protein
MSSRGGFKAPPARLELPSRAPEVYKAVSTLPANAVLADLPLGQTDYDLRAMYYSIERWRPIVNGYSGFFPLHYGGRRWRSMKCRVTRTFHGDAARAGCHARHRARRRVPRFQGRDTTATLRMLAPRKSFDRL